MEYCNDPTKSLFDWFYQIYDLPDDIDIILTIDLKNRSVLTIDPLNTFFEKVKNKQIIKINLINVPYKKCIRLTSLKNYTVEITVTVTDELGIFQINNNFDEVMEKIKTCRDQKIMDGFNNDFNKLDKSLLHISDFNFFKKENLIEVYCDDLSSTRLKTIPIRLTVTGMSNYNMSDLLNFCLFYDTIKIITIVDSDLSIDSINQLIEIIEKCDIVMVDIESGFGSYPDKILQHIFKDKFFYHKELLNRIYFNRLPIDIFSDDKKYIENFKAMRIVSNYIDHLEEID